MSRLSAGPLPGALPGGRSRPELVAEVARGLEVVAHDRTVVVACSGGPDSVALAHLVAEARPDLDLVLAHVRHGLRGRAAEEADVALVRAHADVLDAALEVLAVAVALAGRGVEDAARRARHAALRAVADRRRARWVLYGHTADDQAETVLLRLARGTGLDGLAAMDVARDGRLRPLLRVRRADVHAFVRGEGLDHVVDATNASDAFARNRARHEVLPVLERLAPDPVGALTRLADLARADVEHLDGGVAALAAQHLRPYGRSISVRDDVLDEVGVAMARRLVRLAVQRVRAPDPAERSRGRPTGGEERRLVQDPGDVAGGLRRGDPPTAAQVAGVLALPNGRLAELEGVRVSRGGGWLAFAPEPARDTRQRPLALPGPTAWPAAGLVLLATLAAEASGRDQLALDLTVPVDWRPPDVDVATTAVPPGGDVAFGQLLLPVELSRAAADVVIRARRDGDRIRTGAGTQLVSDVLVDRGVPRVVRDLVPVVEVDGEVVWLPGVAVDAELAARGRHAPAVHVAVTSAASSWAGGAGQH